ncbi:MAG: hypothetical protein WKG06_32580 [Segetibacter sp.]
MKIQEAELYSKPEKASLELIDKKYAFRIDEIEFGKRVAGSVRLALNIGDEIEQTAEFLKGNGANKIADIKEAPTGQSYKDGRPGRHAVHIILRHLLCLINIIRSNQNSDSSGTV